MDQWTLLRSDLTLEGAREIVPDGQGWQILLPGSPTCWSKQQQTICCVVRPAVATCTLSMCQHCYCSFRTNYQLWQLFPQRLDYIRHCVLFWNALRYTQRACLSCVPAVPPTSWDIEMRSLEPRSSRPYPNPNCTFSTSPSFFFLIQPLQGGNSETQLSSMLWFLSSTRNSPGCGTEESMENHTWGYWCGGKTGPKAVPQNHTCHQKGGRGGPAVEQEKGKTGLGTVSHALSQSQGGRALAWPAYSTNSWIFAVKWRALGGCRDSSRLSEAPWGTRNQEV